MLKKQASPLPLDDWLAIARAYSVKKQFPQVRFYVTDPRKFLPAFGGYAEELLTNAVYDGYFTRVVTSLKSDKKTRP